MEWHSREVTSVSSALGFVLRMSRPIGVAPLRFVRQSNGWLVSVSPALCAYTYLFITLLNVTSIAALLLDLSAAPEHSVRVYMPTRRAVWVTDLTVVTFVSSVVGYTAPGQMRDMIVYLNHLHKINFELRNYRTSEPVEKYKMGMAVLCFLGTLILLVVDFIAVAVTSVWSQADVTVACMYCTYYCSYVVLELKEIQFVMIALDIHYSLVSINNGLRSLLRDIDFEYIPHFKQNNSKTHLKIGMPGKIIPAKSINAITDSMVAKKTITATSVRSSRSSAETVRRLALSYSFICDLVKQVDKCYGPILLLLIVSFLLHLVVAPFYLITSLFEETTFSTRLNSLTLQVFWVSFHLVNLVMVIEPAHRTHEEMEITKELVIHLIRTTTTYDHLATELEFFYKQLVLNNNVSYSPLKVFTLNRSLIATILGSITTYLVIVIQL